MVDGADLGVLLSVWGGECDGAPIATELAGKPLPSYPFFQHALAANEGDTVWVQVDETRHPHAIGRPVTIYVTADRTEKEWTSDPTLADVRAGGAQEVVFPGGPLTDNQVAIDAGTLSGNAGTGVGVGYDVVIDVDQSGTLSPGDLIDGLGDLPGFAIVGDLTLPGPYAVSSSNYTVAGVTGGFSSERAYYPTDLDSLPPLPLVIISHGNGHLYTWYDWLGTHLASYGYIVVSHQNNTVPGIETASTTTLQHTQAIIAQQGTVAGGVLGGHIDADTIVWIGHSRGGEGVARAYDRLVDGTFVPSNYGPEDIKLISSIAPTDFLGPSSANPHSAPYHLIYGSADGDVCGCPNNDIADSFNVYERAQGFRCSTYVHGADHNDFNCCGVNDFTGPAGTQIGNAQAQRIAKVAYLALIKHVLEGSPAARDLLWRQYNDLRPLGTLATATVVNELRPAPEQGDFVIDDFQTETSLDVSSSGGAVTFSVSNFVEGKMNDNNTSFSWVATDPMNGMVRGRANDLERNAAFDYSGEAFLEFALVPEAQDVTQWTWLDFRVAQGTRHPRTVAELGDVTFLVTLRDVHGVSQSVDIGAYANGIQEPYQRTGFGTGAGWQNEFEHVRIRLTDFLAEGSGLDLTQIEAVRFEFGAPGTSPQARLALDDLRLSKY